MQRVKAIVSYDGTLFSGYQIQPGMRTVQLEIDKALVKMHKNNGGFFGRKRQDGFGCSRKWPSDSL